MVTSNPPNLMVRDTCSFTLPERAGQTPFGSPAPWSAFEELIVTEQSVQHRGDGGHADLGRRGGVTDTLKGFTGLSATSQTVLEEKPFSGHLFVFRRRRVSTIIGFLRLRTCCPGTSPLPSTAIPLNQTETHPSKMRPQL